MSVPARASGNVETRIVPIGKWRPDVATPVNDGLPFALNIKPRSDGHYGPELAPTVLSSQDTTVFGAALKVHGSVHSVPSNALASSPRYYVGTYAVAAGASRIIARDELGAWENLSKSGGYNVTEFQPWRFANFGNKVLACNLGNPLQISDGGSGVFRDVNAGIRGADVATVRGFAVMVDINDTTHGEGVQNFRVWWSAIANAENWPDPISDEAVTTQSGFIDLLGGGRLQRIIPGIGGADAIVIAERKMWRMRFVGPPQVFDFDEVASDLGTSIPGSVAALDKTFFFYGNNDFYWFDGSNARQIGRGDVGKFFISDTLNAAAFGFQRAIEASIDTEENCYVISYRSQAATGNNNDRILRYNWVTDSWSNAAVGADALGHVDNNSSNTDSPRMAVIGSDFQVSFLRGATLEVTVEGPELMRQSAGYTQVQGVMPLVDSADVVATVRTRDRQDQSLIDSAERGLQNDGFIRFFPTVVSGRFYRCRLRIPAGSSWTAVTSMIYEMTEHGQGPRRTS